MSTIQILCFISFLLTSLSATNRTINALDIECDLFLRYIDNLGLGVYAGKTFKVNEVINDVFGLHVAKSATSYNVLEYYADDVNATHDRLNLGLAMIFNHAPVSEGVMTRKVKNDLSKLHFKTRHKNQVQHKKQKIVDINKQKPIDLFNEAYSRDESYVSNWMIFEGDQIFSNYGPLWFSNKPFSELMLRQQENRDILHIDDIHDRQKRKTAPLSSTQMVPFGDWYDFQPVSSRNVPGCSTKLTYWHTKTQTLRAAVDIPKGMFIEVARALLIPEFTMKHPGEVSQFVWWNPHYAVADSASEDSGSYSSGGSCAQNSSTTDKVAEDSAVSAHRLYAIKPDQKFRKIPPKHILPETLPPGMSMANRVLVENPLGYDHISEDWVIFLLGNGMLYSGVSGDFTAVEHDSNSGSDSGSDSGSGSGIEEEDDRRGVDDLADFDYFGAPDDEERENDKGEEGETSESDKESQSSQENDNNNAPEQLFHFKPLSTAASVTSEPATKSSKDSKSSDPSLKKSKKKKKSATSYRKEANVAYDWWNAYDETEFLADKYLEKEETTNEMNGYNGVSNDSIADVDIESSNSHNKRRKKLKSGRREKKQNQKKQHTNRANHNGNSNHQNTSCGVSGKRKVFTTPASQYPVRHTHKGEECRSSMMISFVAARDIRRDEELIVDLMVDSKTGKHFVHPDFAAQCL